MTSKIIRILAAAFIQAAFLAGCSGITPCDDQRNLPPALDSAVNPKPIPRPFSENNRSHRILVALLDTGVDYNHPALKDSVHFELDDIGRPKRWGWDFIGQDGWPSPYIARRTIHSAFEMEMIDNLIEADPALETFLDKRRNVVQEYMASVWHGTSMAGLVLGDNKEIGLLAYRVVPPNFLAVSSENRETVYAVRIMENLLVACRKAIEDGAGIVVMTTVLQFDGNETPEDHARIRQLKKTFEAIAGSHPQVLFLVSAGNDNGYRYSGRELHRLYFPAGIIADNVWVIGSRTETGGISSFSNVPRGDIRSVFIPGENKICIYPQNMLSLPVSYLTSLPKLLDELREGNESYRSIAAYLHIIGAKRQLAGDGTSFATALAANLCANLWLTHERPAMEDIIEALRTLSGPSLQISYHHK